MFDAGAPNPYHALIQDEYMPAPFAGRETAYTYLYRRINDHLQRRGAVFVGGWRAGKSALLSHFDSYFDETAIGVYIPLTRTDLHDEADWWFALAQASAKTLARRGFPLDRLTPTPEDDALLRKWFADDYVPDILGIIKQRRLVFLLDDVGELITASDRGGIAGDMPAFLHNLLQQHPQLNFAVTISARRETQLTRLEPFVTLADSLRLTRISPLAVTEVLRAGTGGLFTVSDEAAETVYRASGGQPELVQSFGHHIFRRHATQEGHRVSAEDVRTITSVVYNANTSLFERAWAESNRNERVTLTAICGLIFNDPLATITAAGIERWLVETDYLLDMTAINSAIRALEYREMLQTTAGGVTIAAGLLQTWLLEHAEVERDAALPTTRTQPLIPPPMTPTIFPEEVGGTSRRTLLVIVLAGIILGAALAFVVYGGDHSGTQLTATQRPLVTVTLAARITPTP